MTISIGMPNLAIAHAALVTVAAPPISALMSFIPAPPLIEIPPESVKNVSDELEIKF